MRAQAVVPVGENGCLPVYWELCAWIYRIGIGGLEGAWESAWIGSVE